MNWETFVTVEDLVIHLQNPDIAIFDCRFELTVPDKGYHDHLESHIPGSHFVDLEKDLSAEPDGKNGRHPLPSIHALSTLFSKLGIDESVQVICYDDQGGGYAARMWWCLKYLGHRLAAVLEGGFPAWTRAGYPTQSEMSVRKGREFSANPNPAMLIHVDKIQECLLSNELILIDSRTPERYRGEEEPWDPVAGHIPGASNRFWQANLGADQTPRSEVVLAQEFKDLISNRDPSSVVYYCGSGVTGCLNVLAMEYAGLGRAALYAGSWSEWCADPKRPVQTGESP
jgi:thiosulfate/3-mercaptopyruvate sulfurtransferase